MGPEPAICDRACEMMCSPACTAKCVGLAILATLVVLGVLKFAVRLFWGIVGKAV